MDLKILNRLKNLVVMTSFSLVGKCTENRLKNFVMVTIFSLIGKHRIYCIEKTSKRRIKLCGEYTVGAYEGRDK